MLIPKILSTQDTLNRFHRLYLYSYPYIWNIDNKCVIITIIVESSVSEGIRGKGKGVDIRGLEGGQRRE